MDATTEPRSTKRNLAAAAALVAAGAAAGGILAGTIGASAAPTAAPHYFYGGAPGAVAPRGDADGDGPAGHGGHGAFGGSAPVRGDEKALSAADAAKIKAAALKAVPGGTVYRVETDAGDGAYEAHMSKADGTPVTVKFDKTFALIGVEQGMGKGDPRRG